MALMSSGSRIACRSPKVFLSFSRTAGLKEKTTGYHLMLVLDQPETLFQSGEHLREQFFETTEPERLLIIVHEEGFSDQFAITDSGSMLAFEILKLQN